MIKRIFNSQTKTITFAAFLLAASILVSRILGLIRDRILAGRFGVGPELDIYFAAFRIPDFVYGILILGGISAVFLPVFSEYFKKNEEEAWQLANNTLNCFLVLLIIICAILAIFTPFLVNLITPGFNAEQKILVVSLTRIMFLSPILFGLSSVFSGILHYFNRFLVYSIAPILYNLGIIAGILYLYPIFGLQGLAFGVILGAAAYWLIQIPAAWLSGYKYKFTFNFRYSGLMKIFRLMIPRTIGTAAYNINLIVVTAIASTLTAGSIAVFNFSNNLQYFPIGIIGSSFALAAFPALSRSWAGGLKEEFLEHFSSTFRQIFFLTVPISLIIFLLRAQIVRIILGTGQFGWLETRLTAACLGIFCLGIFAFTCIPFLVRVFYSLHNTKTPVIVGLVSVVFNVLLSLSLVRSLQFSNAFQDFMIKILNLQGMGDISIIGLPLALSIAGIFQFFLLLFFLKKQIGDIRLTEIWNSFKKIIIASIFMVVFIYFTLQLVADYVDMNTFSGVFLQAFSAAVIGMLVYFLAALFLKSPEIRVIKDSILKQFQKD